MDKNDKKFVIIDGNALLHRAWHALPPLTTKDGKMVNAVFGFSSILLNIIKDLNPEYGAVAFDPKGKTFRHERYSEYKATRQKQPDELYDQIPLVKEVALNFGFSVHEKQGYEADDVIGALSVKFKKQKIKTIIVTGDMDALQLVGENTFVYTIKRGINDAITYGIAEVFERYGFGPEKVIEYKALAGDQSDNIPGVLGIGEKTAKDLLSKFDSIDQIYKKIDSGGDIDIKDSVVKKLVSHKKDAFLSRELATIDTTLDVGDSLEDFKIKPAKEEEIFEMFRKFEFKSLLRRAEEIFFKYERNNVDNKNNFSGQGSLFFGSAKSKESDIDFKIRHGYELIDTSEKAMDLVKILEKSKFFAIDSETDALGARVSNMIGFSVSEKPGKAYYILSEYAPCFKEVLENPRIRKIGHNIKYEIEVFHKVDIDINPISFDSMIASYVLRPAGRSHSLDNLVFTELGHHMVPITDLIGPKGKNQLSLSDVSLNKVADYAAEDADYTLRLALKLSDEIEKNGFSFLMEKIEMPLVKVLAKIEENGVKIDSYFLNKMSNKVGKDIIKIEQEIFEYSKTKFNVASPVQLKEVLFGKLGISTKGIGKTKTGFSTAFDQLEKISDAHPIIPLVMRHRELSKLKNTYLDSLPDLVDEKTKRVHTSFNQTITSTGRLSSSDPNLQNIPIRTELGSQIRKAFIPENGNVLISADYSQIELRVAASISGDKNLIEIFKHGKDIHTATAAFVHGIPEKEVTPEIRRTAKEINFGVLYGMGSRGLAQRTGMSVERAKDFIEKYFESFSGIKKFIEENIELARTRGFVETKFGRRLSLPDINSNMPQIRSAAERLATNMPIQGTAADIMKMAMIAVDKNLDKVSPLSKIIIQVHDELVLEVPKKEVAKVSEFLKEEMESCVKLDVPIVVEVNCGANWQEAH